MAAEVQKAEAQQGFDLLFYGDSITEHWRGTSMGAPDSTGPSIHDMWNKYFGSYNADVMAIAADQIEHLHWRLLNGEMPTVHPPRAAVVLIGTNDFEAAGRCGAGEQGMTAAADGVGDRLERVLGLMRERMPATHIIIMALLPRSYEQPGQWPSQYSKGMMIVNDRMEALASSDDQLHFIDCNAAYLLPDGSMNVKLVPDGVHPNAEGHGLMAECLLPLITQFVHPQPGGPVSEPDDAVQHDLKWQEVAKMLSL
ncbi:hypothetical protein WJX72_004014 [[Myrmecia] bisecta]|uniref:SGNH hydrolase-type esterase domain-containing protein n=1 Tax=[Myrmecia] bisecta TaxID=41462 RepID=A0AAW1R5R9_9CHLO